MTAMEPTAYRQMTLCGHSCLNPPVTRGAENGHRGQGGLNGNNLLRKS